MPAMPATRRGVISGGLAGAALLLAASVATPAWALNAAQAQAQVQAAINELVALLRQSGPATSRAARLRQIMETYGNLPQIAKFSAGRIWREMTPQQQQRFVDAFAKYVSVTYARRFDEYAGDPKIGMGQAIDAGKKGFVVETPIQQPDGRPIDVRWLVSDRGGKVEIIDLIIEGVSMAATQREQIAAIYDKRGGDVDALINELATAG